MELTVSQHAGYSLAKTDGPLDESARDIFRERLHPVVGQRGALLVLDLSSSPRINSPGIGSLVALTADANTQGSRVVLCGLTPFVAGVMQVTRLNQFFEIADNADAAVAKTA